MHQHAAHKPPYFFQKSSKIWGSVSKILCSNLKFSAPYLKFLDTKTSLDFFRLNEKIFLKYKIYIFHFRFFSPKVVHALSQTVSYKKSLKTGKTITIPGETSKNEAKWWGVDFWRQYPHCLSMNTKTR